MFTTLHFVNVTVMSAFLSNQCSHFVRVNN